MPRSIITLTTDFGLSDHFVGTMKGVILGIHPLARIVDISHEASPFDVTEAGFVLAQSYRYFPPGTVHVVVVDPGVGSSRRPILVEAAKQYFVAPDNGVLAMVYAREMHRVRAITGEEYFLRPVSRTFHGRDIFAPVAAHLAKGVAPAKFGKLIEDYLKPVFEKPMQVAPRIWTGKILKIDRFGNMITNFHIGDFPNISATDIQIRIGSHAVTSLVHAYAECGRGELALIVGSSGYVEIVSCQTSAAKLAGCGAGAAVELSVL